MSELKTRMNFSNIQIVILLSILISISIIIRISILPSELPIYQDGEVYFWYANDMNILKEIPIWEKNTFPNTLWPTILSGFFSIISSDNFIDYMTLQRILSLSLSVLTVIPVFFLCKKFVDARYAVIASCLFLFEPRLIQTSLNGLTEPLFLLLGSISILLFMNKKMFWVIVSFGVLALFSLTRYEGLVLIIPFSIMFFWKYRNKKYLTYYFIGIIIFLTIILSINSLENRAFENSTFGHLVSGGNYYIGNVELENECPINDKMISCTEFWEEKNVAKNSRTLSGIFNLIINMVKYYGWITIPLFFIFIPIGLYKFFQNRNFEKWTVLICAIFMLIPAFYAFSRDFQEVRYLYIQIPFLCIIAATSIEFFGEKIKKPKIMIFIFLTGIILTGGIFFYDQTLVNYELEVEYFEISKKINVMMTVSNEIFPADNYIRSGTIAGLDEFPVLRNSFDYFSMVMIPNDDHDSLEELIQFGKENGLKHLVIDTDGDGINYLYDVFNNEEKYPFLEKIYDSRSDGFTYHVKFFKINYDEFRKYYE